ncbi:MAG: hypothetical protein COB96_01240 [Planctomycetota bacterium]|nr:MAG: hypothetical protein COB96_01240 [Planctomycetota bacterium]
MTEQDINKQLTDYLMGELDPASCKVLEAALAEDANLRSQLEQLRDLREMIGAAETKADQLSRERRATLSAAAGSPSPDSGNFKIPRSGRLLRFPTRFGWAAAAVMVAAGIALLEKNTELLSPAFESETSASATMMGGKEKDATNTRERLLESRRRSMLDKTASEPGLRSELRTLGYIGANSGEQPAADRLGELLVAKAPSAPSTGGLSATPSTPDGGSSPAIGIGGGGGGRSGGKYGGRGGRGGVATNGTTSRGLLQSDGALRRRYAFDNVAVDEVEEELGLGDELVFDSEFDFKVPRFYLRDGYGRNHHGQGVIRHLHRRPHESPRDMFFRYYGDNPAVRAREDALSTFAADVDTASWALARNYLVNNNVPEKAAIRTEEFLNWFDFEMSAPADQDFAVYLNSAPSRYAHRQGEGEYLPQLLNIGIKARAIAAGNRKPLNLVFVVDRSGSMRKGVRMELVKRSLELLIDQLRDDDTVGIVSFESHARLELEPTRGSERWRIREAVRSIEIGGSTNAEAGLLMGYELAESAWREGAVNRVVFCSDGVANTGETDQQRILEKVRFYAERKIDLTTIGVGMGNHNDVFLERLADHGDGSCHYIDDYEEAKHILVERFIGTMQTIARDVKIQVEFNPEVVSRWRQIGYENRALADQDFRNDAVDAGEIGSGHAVSALYEFDLKTSGDLPWVVKVRLRWFADGSDQASEQEWELSAADLQTDWSETSFDYKVAAVTTQFAEFLRRSYWARGDSFRQLLDDARSLVAERPENSQVRELHGMIKRTQTLVRHFLQPDDELSILIEESRRLRLLEAEIGMQTEITSELHAKLDELKQRNQKLEEEIRRLLE